MKFIRAGHAESEKYWIKELGLGGLRQVSKEEWDRLQAEEAALLPQASEDADLPGNRPWTQPILSEALAVHPEQIGEAMERNAAHGLHVDYDRDSGRPILRSRQERNKLCQIEGVHDKDGGYGDRHY